VKGQRSEDQLEARESSHAVNVCQCLFRGLKKENVAEGGDRGTDEGASAGVSD
jgi:hypothetical protein